MLFCLAVLLVLFYALDSWLYRREGLTAPDPTPDDDRFGIEGGFNLALLLVIMGLVAITMPSMAVSAGAVFMGANSYIGNAPSLMVKAAAEERGAKMPGSFGYMLWSGRRGRAHRGRGRADPCPAGTHRLGKAARTSPRHQCAALLDVRQRAVQDHRGHPGSGGDREGPASSGPGPGRCGGGMLPGRARQG